MHTRQLLVIIAASIAFITSASAQERQPMSHEQYQEMARRCWQTVDPALSQLNIIVGKPIDDAAKTEAGKITARVRASYYVRISYSISAELKEFDQALSDLVDNTFDLADMISTGAYLRQDKYYASVRERLPGLRQAVAEGAVVVNIKLDTPVQPVQAGSQPVNQLLQLDPVLEAEVLAYAEDQLATSELPLAIMRQAENDLTMARFEWQVSMARKQLADYSSLYRRLARVYTSLTPIAGDEALLGRRATLLIYQSMRLGQQGQKYDETPVGQALRLFGMRVTAIQPSS